MILLCKAILGQGQCGLMRWIWLWLTPLVQDQSLDLLTCSPTHYQWATDAPLLFHLKLESIRMWYAYTWLENEERRTDTIVTISSLSRCFSEIRTRATNHNKRRCEPVSLSIHNPLVPVDNTNHSVGPNDSLDQQTRATAILVSSRYSLKINADLEAKKPHSNSSTIGLSRYFKWKLF